METWTQACAPFTKYEVSSEGRIRNRSGYILRGGTSTGYVRVGLRSDAGKFSTVLVHRLVAETFHSTPNPKEIAHHINGETLDNRSINLAWVSQAENRRLAAAPRNCKARAVLQKDMAGNLVNRWERLKDVPFNRSLVWRACTGRVPMAYGYLWSYDDTSNQGETWVTITFEGRELAVSDQGRVTLPTGKITTGCRLKAGYYTVRPFKGQSVVVHRLVALAFLPAPAVPVSTLTVNHKNFDKGDNRAVNLEWATQSENNAHSQQTRGSSRVPRRAVVQHLPSGETCTFTSLADASRELGISRGNLCMACQGLRPTAGGFRWSYAD